MAFEKSIGVVAGSDENDCKVCCCMHAHKDDCLWLRYRDKFGEDKAHELHTAGCKCFKKSVEGAYNDHSLDCKDYERFYSELIKVDKNQTFIKNCHLPHYLQLMPAANSNKRMIMCCCSSDLAHNER